MMFIENLVHGTSRRIAVYDFDILFCKFPSYLRRAAINEAIGIVNSYHSNCKNWDNNGRNGKEPRLQLNHYAYPTLFKDNMFVRLDDYTAKIKIYHNNDWVWLKVKLRKSDADYIIRHKSGSKQTVPTLEKKGKNWYLRFAFIDNMTLYKDIDIIISVDLGINNAAACSAMLPDGTIIGRKIINFPVEQDQMEHKLNKIKKAQSTSGSQPMPMPMPRLWAYVNNLNRTISEKTAGAIIEFASLYNSKTIVFENLNFKGKKKGSKKQRLHMWRKKAVIAIVTLKAHLLKMRVSTVNPWGTSRLAFDGSGKVLRSQDNYSMCTFQSGKRYHCDLSASYNIGARYYIRERLKSLPVTVRLGVEAKVPQLTKRTTCTLSDLINLNAEIIKLKAI